MIIGFLGAAILFWIIGWILVWQKNNIPSSWKIEHEKLSLWAVACWLMGCVCAVLAGLFQVAGKIQ